MYYIRSLEVGKHLEDVLASNYDLHTSFIFFACGYVQCAAARSAQLSAHGLQLELSSVELLSSVLASPTEKVTTYQRKLVILSLEQQDAKVEQACLIQIAQPINTSDIPIQLVHSQITGNIQTHHEPFQAILNVSYLARGPSKQEGQLITALSYDEKSKFLRISFPNFIAYTLGVVIQCL